MSAHEIRSLVCAFVKPAREEGLVRRGEAGDSKSHCQVVIFRGTIESDSLVTTVGALGGLAGRCLRSISGWLLLNGIVVVQVM